MPHVIPLGPKLDAETLSKLKEEIRVIFVEVPDIWNDLGKAEEIKDILERYNVPFRGVFYDFKFSGDWSKPQKFCLFTADNKILAEENVAGMFGTNYPRADAYAKFGYMLGKVGIRPRGNMHNLIKKHEKKFPGFAHI